MVALNEEALNLRFPIADAVFDSVPEIAEDMKQRPNGEPSHTYLRDLLKSGTPEEAITFCAYLLATRESVWWGHECLAHFANALTERDPQLLDLVENWVREPNEDTRYAAMEAGLACEPKTAGAWLSLAAGWSGGSMSEREQPPVPPPPHLSSRMVNIAILTTVAHLDRSHRSTALKECIDIAFTIVEH